MERKNILALFLLAAFILIIEYAKNLNLHYPDEHFQTIEIATNLVHGYGWKSWEWVLGTRSYVGPFFYTPIVYILSFLKINSGELLIYCLKCTTGFFVFSGIAASIYQRKKKSIFDLMFALTLCLHPALLYFSTTTFTDTLSLFLVACFFNYIRNQFQNNDSSTPTRSLISGLFLGLLIAVRLQNILFTISCFILFLTKEKRKYLYSFIFGIGISLFFIGLVDWITLSYPFQSIALNLYYNIFKGVASQNGVSPFTFYFSAVTEQFGFTFTLLGCLCLFYQFFFKKEKIYLLALIFFSAHSLISHKEFRFILPVIIFFIHAICDTFEEFKKILRPHFRVYSGVFILLLIFSFTPKWKSSEFSSPNDLSELTFIAGPLLLKQNSDHRNLLIVDHYWVWGRGESGMGTKVIFKEIKSSELSEMNLSDYPVIIFGSLLNELILLKLNKTHHFVFEDPSRKSIWERNSL